MKHLTIPNLPDDLYDVIERRARVAGRSAADEAAEMLAKGVADADAREAALLDDLRSGHEEMAKKGIFVTTEDILSAVEWGRE